VKQIVQNPKSGALELLEVPAPAPQRGQLLVRNAFSVVSPGTEKTAIDFARKSLLGKAQSRPDLVRQVLRKLSHEGPLPTYQAVMNRLDQPQPLGYSCAGVVEGVGPGVRELAVGDRVACAGAGYAVHAEWIAVPENLCARVPDGVSLERAAFSTLGAIALQGLRVAAPTLGEIAAVIGLGLIGQLAVQLLRANGCRVLGIDLSEARVKQALALGAEWGAAPDADHGPWKSAATGGYGADLALVTAASESSAPIALAAELCRMKGRIAVVGATAMDLERRSFYDKELELRMSMSYGPGRYDRHYEEQGLDYPIAYVRWTENRNLQAFLALCASGGVDPLRLELAQVEFEDAERAYEELASGKRGALATLFRYAERAAAPQPPAPPRPAPSAKRAGEIGVAFVGAGNYARAVLLPALGRVAGVRKQQLVTATGASAAHSARKFGFAGCGTDAAAVFADPAIDLVFIATRHETHAELAAAALRAGKAVWCEKPLAIDEAGLDAVARAVAETQGFLCVGFNRRFSPHAMAVRDAFAARRGPLAIAYTVAAGPAPRGSWIADAEVGGGRLLGEVCHFVDLCSFVVGAAPVEVGARFLARDPATDDSVVCSLHFADGSQATIHYLASASSALPKERFEVSGDGRTALCDNFRRTRILPRGAGVRGFNQDKGQAAAVARVVESMRAGKPSPIPFSEIEAVTRATLRLAESAASGALLRVARGEG
jgi:predicted dehydrogenase/threonine dehydrogenase-like Zn-dependent dehydrogenase